MSHIIYRNTTIGDTLQETLDEFTNSKAITAEISLKIMSQFDKSLMHVMNQMVRNRVTIKGKLKTYRNYDNVWTFVVDQASVKAESDTTKYDHIRIIAAGTKDEDGKEISIVAD
eukprot:Opistho-2@48603